MKLDKLTIFDYKNLQNFFIDFDEESLTTVVVGRNGVGKSNVLEALVVIFRDLDLGAPPAFKYELDYICRNHKIHIDADPGRDREQVATTVDGEPISYKRFSQQEDRRYLPSHVFGYYSGLNDRMESHFNIHQKRFYDDLLANKPRPLRPLFYARLVHSQFVLLSFFNEQDSKIMQFLHQYLRIEGLDSVLFVMRQPSWSSREGDPRFWKARGKVQEFLDELYKRALAPLRTKQRIALGFRKHTTLEHLYLYVKDVETLRDLANVYQGHQESDHQESGHQEFFKALESTYISEVIREVRIRVRIRNMDGTLTFRDLSEGEQQLLMVLGLLRFTKEEEALFLLDEPDTHLNPAWGMRYLDFLEDIVGNHETSHIIMSTHNPLVIAGLERSEVRIMQKDESSGRVYTESPREDPKGMGVAGILTSDLFGLRSTLDSDTQGKLDERRILAAKTQRLTAMERRRLSELNEELEGLDFTITMRDPLYEQFVKAMTRRGNPSLRRQAALTPKQQEEQKQLTLDILSEIEQDNRG